MDAPAAPRFRPAVLLVAIVCLIHAACLAGQERAAGDGGAGGGASPVNSAADVAIPAPDPGAAADLGADEAPAASAGAAPVELNASTVEEPPAPVCLAPTLGTEAPVPHRATAPPAIGASAAVVIDGDTGAVLWGRNEHVALQPASVTKILTALIAVERGNLDEVIPVTLEQRLLNRGTRMGLVTGDWFTLRDLLYGLMLPSGNDAAAVIAHHFAGSEAGFAAIMNARLCELGLTDSVFINPSGLGRTEHNLASAYDLAQIARAAMAYPAFRELAAARSWTATGSRTLPMRNLNELVGSFAGADGVKIGWTPGAGNTIVASATRNRHRVIVALLNTPNRAGESAALLEWAFATFRWPV